MYLLTRSFVLAILVFTCIHSAHTQYSDNFEEMSGMAHWQIFHSGDSVYYQSLMYHDSLVEGMPLQNTEGRLVMTCGATYWYANVTGSYVYQMTWGDFVATTAVHAYHRSNPTSPPQSEFNSAGLIVRNPDTANGQNYIMTNLGMQSAANGIGSESKTTVNSGSILYLDPDLYEGEVRLTRTGTLIRTYKRTGADPDFILLDEFDRPDIPDTVQIGMVLNGYTADPDIRGEFEYIHFLGGDCRIIRTTEDDGVSSLRAAIECASAGDTLTFDHAVLTDTLVLTSGPLVINKDLRIESRDGHRIVMRSAGDNPLIQIDENTTVFISGIDVLGGEDPDHEVIINSGILTLVDCTVNADPLSEGAVSNEGILTIRGNCAFH